MSDMKLVIALLLAVTIALSAQQVLGACTNATCTTTVTVFQSFDTPDCSGEYTLEPDTDYTQSCENFFSSGNYNTSRRYTCSNGAFNTGTHVGINCAGTAATVQSVPVGVCQRTGVSASQIYWCNAQSVSSTFKAVKSAQNVTIAQDSSHCNVTTGCPGNTGAAYYYSEAGCNSSKILQVGIPSFVFGYDVAATLGTCYVNNQTESYDNRNNFLATCENGRYTIKAFTGGCGSSANLIYSRNVLTDQCLEAGPGFWLRVTCSSASTLAASPIVFLLLLAFLFL